MKKTIGAFLTMAAWLCIPQAGVAGALITVDENGNAIGASGQGFLAFDPGPGGLNSVLNYKLPFAGVQGDIGLTDAGLPVAIIRFNGSGTLLIYSSNVDGFDALSDTPGPPMAFYPNFLSIAEVGSQANHSTMYTPFAEQPGYDPLAQPTYIFRDSMTLSILSDSVDTPESSTMVLLAMGLAFFALRIPRPNPAASSDT